MNIEKNTINILKRIGNYSKKVEFSFIKFFLNAGFQDLLIEIEINKIEI